VIGEIAVDGVATGDELIVGHHPRAGCDAKLLQQFGGGDILGGDRPVPRFERSPSASSTPSNEV
jgi:hypothetical protein